MTNFITSDAATSLIQVIMIDLVLAGDNAVVIALAAAGLPATQRKRAIMEVNYMDGLPLENDAARNASTRARETKAISSMPEGSALPPKADID